MEINLQWSKLCSGIWFFAECLQKDCGTAIAMALTSIFFSFEFQVADKQRGKKFETPIGEGIQVEQKYAWSWWQASHQVQYALKRKKKWWDDEFFIREEMLELRQRALNRLEEEGMSLFNPADVERLRNEDRYVER